MSTLPTNELKSTNQDTFHPPVLQHPRLWRQFEQVIDEVVASIAPVWPLQDYVAVNPYLGYTEQSFLGARSRLRSFSNCELLMPLHYFASQFRAGELTHSDIEAAINELRPTGVAQGFTAADAVEWLSRLESEHGSTRRGDTEGSRPDRLVQSVAELLLERNGVDWPAIIRDEISKHCAAHYDQGQAGWASPWKNLSLFDAWRSRAAIDCNLDAAGLVSFRKFVELMPRTAEAAIAESLQTLKVPESLWSTYLLCEAHTVLGWCAWAKYQDEQKLSANGDDLKGLLAMRLAHDAALALAFDFEVSWDSLLDATTGNLKVDEFVYDDAELRYTLQRANEIAYRRQLVTALEPNATAAAGRKLAQMVFCIDVRSERIRRQLEATSSDVETFGFAGFFGVPMSFVRLGEPAGTSQLPVLLKPQFEVYEGVHDSAHEDLEHQFIAERQHVGQWRLRWTKLQQRALSCFTYVESVGLFYGFDLLRRSWGKWVQKSAENKSACLAHEQIAPTLRGLNRQGVTTSRQVDLAESILRNMGLIEQFAKLVVLCGHGSSTENNPLAAGLDCGACGGHTGEPNARFAAMLLNQPYVRQGLQDRGIVIPEDTYFMAALHDTTKDQLHFYDADAVPPHLRMDLKKLMACSQEAGQRAREERAVTLSANSDLDLLRRATDWSEVRPEWGLAGNAAFIAAPRSMTQHAVLDAKTFLHSYDARRDPAGTVLETIMTAPMIVAHWINMQYYASTVDPQRFGSGDKTIHNVVGRFGILSGNSGDLMTGLPWQSLHTGTEYQHHPRRLQVVIAASRQAIDRVISKHSLVANLLNNQWLHLVAIEGGQLYRYAADSTWELLPSVVDPVTNQAHPAQAKPAELANS